MGTNRGKFVDTSPIICAAGKVSGHPDENENVAGCMRQYTADDGISAMKHELGRFKQPHDSVFDVMPRLVSKRHPGIYNECRGVLRLPDQTRFQTLINDLKETSYNSYWTKNLGKSTDPTAGLPAGMDPVAVTFGKPSEKDISVKELVNPPKTVYEVLWDSQIGHEMYKKTHNDYNPSEKICRGYLKPSYDPDKRYGIRGKYDLRGILVKCACTWHNNEPVTVVNDIQAHFKKNKPHLGKCATPNNIADSVPKEHVIGKLCSHDFYAVEDLVKDPDCSPCLLKRDFYEWMRTLNELRNVLRKRDTTRFTLKQFYEKLSHYDEERTGWLPKEVLYKLCNCDSVNFKHEALEPLLSMLGFLRENHIHYRSFVNLLDVNKPTPQVQKIQDIPEKNLYYVTTSQAAACDYLVMNNAYAKIAGLPTRRSDLQKLPIKFGQCAADKDHLGDETSAAALVNPSIYTNYGLSHRDFFAPREANELKKLFENLGYKFPDSTFEELWKKGVHMDKTGLVCIETFKNLLKQINLKNDNYI